MNILIAPDSFKESLNAKEVSLNIKKGLKKSKLKCNIEILPMADGGEGTVESLVDATDGKIINTEVTGPLGNKIEAFFGVLGNDTTAVIEMAAASGLPLLTEEQKNPEKTTTYGTGELIEEALDYGCNEIIIGIGGSATNDLGVGMAQALGASFKDETGNEISFGGQELSKISKIDLRNLDKRISKTDIKVACDVDNPLYGKKGAAYIYGPQKGASKEQIKRLDDGLKNSARVIKKDLNKEIDYMPGAGAAGGLGGGLVAFLEAELKPGIEIVIEASKIHEILKENIDLVITGEGRLDNQTVHGKTPIGVARAAKEYNIPVIAICGSVGNNANEVLEHGIDSYFSILNSPTTFKEAKEVTPSLIESLSLNLGNLIDKLNIGVK